MCVCVCVCEREWVEEGIAKFCELIFFHCLHRLETPDHTCDIKESFPFSSTIIMSFHQAQKRNCSSLNDTKGFDLMIIVLLLFLVECLMDDLHVILIYTYLSKLFRPPVCLSVCLSVCLFYEIIIF